MINVVGSRTIHASGYKPFPFRCQQVFQFFQQFIRKIDVIEHYTKRKEIIYLSDAQVQHNIQKVYHLFGITGENVLHN